MTADRLRLGTRGSELALTQTRSVADAIGDAELIVIRTADGEVGDKSRFVGAIEAALLAGEVDVGVHSAKDLPSEMPAGLRIGAALRREDPLDVVCVAPALAGVESIGELPEGATVGTSSLRRRAQLLALRPDLRFNELRGNVDTRLRRLAGGELDAIVLAAAGLRRLGRENEAAFALGVDELTPAPGQGTLVLQTRAEEAIGAVLELDDAPSSAALTAERAAVAGLDASCDTPVGVYAEVADGLIRIRGFAGMPDGSEWIRDRIEARGDDADAESAGRELAGRMLATGAGELLARAAKAARPRAAASTGEGVEARAGGGAA